jgi:hypothetical protein
MIEPPHGLCTIIINLSPIAYRKRTEQKKEMAKLLPLLLPGAVGRAVSNQQRDPRRQRF